MEQREKIKLLIAKYLDGKCSDEEALIVERFYIQQSLKAEEPGTTNNANAETEIWQKIVANNPTLKKSSSKVNRYWFAASVAIFLIFGGLFTVKFISHPGKNGGSSQVATIIPGSNKAVLTLSNGRKIILTNASNGTLAKQSNTEIIKTKEGEISYQNDSAFPKLAEVIYNSVETPAGGQFKMVLPDGTKVWLNALSSLKYPVHFLGDTRNVELTGEGYFEVAHDPKHPFIVKTSQQKIQVLGTHFNVNAYKDELAARTTLLEGSVRIRTLKGTERILVPGQQSVVDEHGIDVIPADMEQATAWKNGDFSFSNASIQMIMRQISRWYNVDVSFEDKLGDTQFGGSISRSKPITDVLNVLEATQGVHFKIEGRRIIVMR